MKQQPWEQLEGESASWYGRFTTYRLMGDKRSFLAAYNTGRKKPARSISKTWQDAVEKYNWSERVEAWDIYQRELQELKFEKDREKAREARQTNILALTTLLGRVMINEQKTAETKAKILAGKDKEKQIAAVKEAGISAKVIKDLAAAAALIMKESRVEFGEPTDIQQVQGKGEDGAIPIDHVNVMGLKGIFQNIGQREHDNGHDEDEA